jgi:hypothetical protein
LALHGGEVVDGEGVVVGGGFDAGLLRSTCWSAVCGVKAGSANPFASPAETRSARCIRRALDAPRCSPQLRSLVPFLLLPGSVAEGCTRRCRRTQVSCTSVRSSSQVPRLRFRAQCTLPSSSAQAASAVTSQLYCSPSRDPNKVGGDNLVAAPFPDERAERAEGGERELPVSRTHRSFRWKECG